MFDSGVKPDDVDRLFLDRNEVAILDNKVWIPVEATLVGKPFFSAWKQGALKYSQMKADQFVNEISMTKAMAKYLPGSITPEEVYIPDPTGVSELLEEDIRQYIKWLDQVVAKGIEGKLETADDYYDVAVLYMEFGRYQSAIDNLNTAMGITPNFPDALNTLGVCYTKQEEYEKSIEFYNKALEQQANHPGFILNIAISQFMLGNKGLAKQKYDEAVALAPSFSGKLEDCPDWSFDGSSTQQAEGGSSDCLLKPVAVHPDPVRKNGFLVMTDVLNADGTPHVSNGRATIDDDDNDFWFGFEQEYFLWDPETLSLIHI